MKGVITVKTPEVYSTESIYELMKKDGNFQYPYDLTGKGFAMLIKFPLNKNNVIQVCARKNTVTLNVAKENIAKAMGMTMLTDGWSDILDSTKKDTQALLEEIAEEVRRITGGK